MEESSVHLRNRFIKKLRSQNLTVAFAESMTCGLAAHQLSKVKGTRDVLQGGVVCYHKKVKTGLFKVPTSLIEKHSAESEEVTVRLARSLNKLMTADIHAAITGLAAPGGSETRQKPVGTVFVAVLFRKKLHTSRIVFRGSPRSIMQKACDETYRLILRAVATRVA